MGAIGVNAEPGMGRAIKTAALIGTVAMLGTGIGMSMVGGTSFVDALGIGAFAALWGGPGFGGMGGAIYYVAREDKRNRSAGH